MRTPALLLVALVALSGCSERPAQAPSSSLPAQDARNAAKTVALLVRGQVCTIAPTGSMRPTFDEHAVVVTEPVRLADVRVGDIVVRRDAGLLIVHRVVRVEGGQLVTRGDANPADDPGSVGDAQLAGRVVAIIYGRSSASSISSISTSARDPRPYASPASFSAVLIGRRTLSGTVRGSPLAAALLPRANDRPRGLGLRVLMVRPPSAVAAAASSMSVSSRARNRRRPTSRP